MMEPIVERHCWAEIDLDALCHNFAYVQKTVGGPVCAVVKADAYGHGDAAVAQVLQQQGAAGFAVSCLAEAKHLRRCGITAPILILGYTDPCEAAALAQQGLATTCFSTAYAQALSAAAVQAGVQVDVHLKVDTGMGRLGFTALRSLPDAVRELEALYAAHTFRPALTAGETPAARPEADEA